MFPAPCFLVHSSSHVLMKASTELLVLSSSLNQANEHGLFTLIYYTLRMLCVRSAAVHATSSRAQQCRPSKRVCLCFGVFGETGGQHAVTSEQANHDDCRSPAGFRLSLQFFFYSAEFQTPAAMTRASTKIQK